MPIWTGLAIFVGVGILMSAILLLSLIKINVRDENEKATEGQGEEDNTSVELQGLGYDTTGRRFPTEIEKLAESDSPEITKIQKSTERKIIADQKRRNYATAKRRCNRNEISRN